MSRTTRRVVLGVYWLLLLVATHVPPFWDDGEPPQPDGLFHVGPDKLGHFVGFGLLAWLVAINLKPTRHRPLLAGAIVLVYAVFDELTQPPFDRTADIYDYLFNVAGVVFAMTLFAFAMRRRADA